LHLITIDRRMIKDKPISQQRRRYWLCR